MKNFKKFVLFFTVVFVACLLTPGFYQLSYHFTAEKAMESYIGAFPDCFLPLKSPSVNDKIKEIYTTYDINSNERLFLTKAGEHTDDLYVTVCKVEKFFATELYKATGIEMVVTKDKDIFEYGDLKFLIDAKGRKIEDLLKGDNFGISIEVNDKDLVVISIEETRKTG